MEITLVTYGLVSMIGTVASTSTSYISLIIIGIHVSHSDAGIYSSVLTIVSILMFFPKLFTQVFLPEFSKLFGEGDKKRIFQISPSVLKEIGFKHTYKHPIAIYKGYI